MKTDKWLTNRNKIKEAGKHDIPVIWWPSVKGGTNGAKLEYVNKHNGSGNFTYCIITDRETVLTFTSLKVTSKTGKQYNKGGFIIHTDYLNFLFCLFF